MTYPIGARVAAHHELTLHKRSADGTLSPSADKISVTIIGKVTEIHSNAGVTTVVVLEDQGRGLGRVWLKPEQIIGEII